MDPKEVFAKGNLVEFYGVEYFPHGGSIGPDTVSIKLRIKTPWIAEMIYIDIPQKIKLMEFDKPLMIREDR